MNILRRYPSQEAAKKVFCEAPVCLTNGLALTRAAELGVMSEVAWIAMLVDNGAVKKQLNFDTAIASLWSQLTTAQEAVHFNIRKLKTTRAAHVTYGVKWSSMSREYLKEAVTASFAAMPTSLCRVIGGQGFCAGYPFTSSSPDGHTVALGLRKVPGKGAVPTMELDVTAWVGAQLGYKLPRATTYD